MGEFAYWSARKVAAEIKAGRLKSRDYVDAMLARIPRLDKKSPNWVKAVNVASKTGKPRNTTNALAAARTRGVKSDDGLSGVCKNGYAWRKSPENGHVFYLNESLIHPWKPPKPSQQTITANHYT